MKTGMLEFDLPDALIAQHPAARRRDARLMTVDRGVGAIGHRRFAEFPSLLRAGDLLVLNDTRVIRGRLRSKRPTGGAVEIFLLSQSVDAASDQRVETWLALARPSKRLQAGDAFDVGEGVTATLLAAEGDGRWTVRLTAPGPVEPARERAGEIPLPPYIRRSPGDANLSEDATRYQTVFARRPGSVAAPTAGLHFDPELLDEVRRLGVSIAYVTLSVGYGTFSPIRTESVEDYDIHAERYRLPEETAEAVASARARGGRVVAVGTTSVRTLETCAADGGLVCPGEGETRIFLYPGRPFRVVDAMLTNFHLPKSSLLALVMAFGGIDLVRSAYAEAVAGRYRFFSYGDAMFLS
ncbi:MAG TPA: tRNA preQ1(34) S-adenosylmethionine ribosyltransferase-isomerase QueA [Candidatus Deferrimicrobiaceae bacterium]